MYVYFKKIPVGSENGIVMGYHIQYKTPLDLSYTRIFITGSDTLQYNITGLAPWTDYDVRIAAMTVALGPWSLPVASKTMESGKYGYVGIEFG